MGKIYLIIYKPFIKEEKMVVIIWEFKVKLENVMAFEDFYNSKGKWAKLFSKSQDFLGLELLKNSEKGTYLTIDRWNSLGDFEKFRLRFEKEYQVLDQLCKNFTISEQKVGVFSAI